MTPGPIPLFIFLALAGALFLPVIWWLIAYWQRKKNLLQLYKVSLFFSLTPMASFGSLFMRDFVPSEFALIVFSLTPVVNIFGVLVVLIITFIYARKTDNAL